MAVMLMIKSFPYQQLRFGGVGHGYKEVISTDIAE